MGNNMPQRSSNQRSLETPEGVEIKIALASYGQRAIALFLDLVIIGVSFIVFAFMVFLLHVYGLGDNPTAALVILGYFLLRNFYFIFFELRWRGKTPGKRIMDLRVVDSHGRPLAERAIFARNLMREIEVFLPMTIVIAVMIAENFAPTSWFYLLWIGIFLVLPLLHPDRMRAGDMIAGTLVVQIPDMKLGQDVLQEGYHRNTRDEAGGMAAAIVFSERQLSAYGIFELQTLEQVLRSTQKGSDKAREEVGSRIKKKIGWVEPSDAVPMDVFLDAFYLALRDHLESKMLMGERRENKFSTPASEQQKKRAP